MRIILDIEANGLLQSSIDYTQSPYRLKDSFQLHCIVTRNLETGEEIEWRNNWKDFREFCKQVEEVVGHNLINFDLLVLKLFLGMDYTIGPDTWDGRSCKITDTMVISKTLNPDRGGHSLEWWGEKLGEEKMDWRAEAVSLNLISPTDPKGAEFSTYHPRMGDYCRQDTRTTEAIHFALKEEMGSWDWTDAIELEKAVMELITRQSHRGFHFNVEQAKTNIEVLDKLMEDRRLLVEPLLPMKPITQTKKKSLTPPVKTWKKDGTLTAHAKKWWEEVYQDEEGNSFGSKLGKTYPLPWEGPLYEEEPMKISDSSELKGWLVSEFGWQPTEWGDRDLTKKGPFTKTKEEYQETVERYVEQTLSGPFRDLRCEELGVAPENLRSFLLKKRIGRSVKVPTNPKFTVGMEKEICPNLLKLENKFPHAKAVVEYLTYSHRRSFIQGGVLDEDGEATTGVASLVREDGRIPTEADTCGAATARFKHRGVANVPRVTSLFGWEMRRLFQPGEGRYQIGYDFSSLISGEL